ncbi:uncharacterized protein LOC134226482 [Armigeres subalbatus]|uniref:uncharacterized protein LOC134226482 n=1 Tax=Armigeres subalbatus TaxID=124917 RepID=UPI002ED4B8FA
MASSADLINNLLTDLQFPRNLLQKLDDSGIGILSLITISEEQLRDYLRLLDLDDTDFDSSYYYELLQSWRARNKPAIQRLVSWCIYKDFAAEPPATPKGIIDPPVDVSCRAPCQSTASVIRTDILTEKQIFQAAASDTALVPLDISSGNCFVKSTLPAAEEEGIISPSSGQATSRLSPPAINQISVGGQSQPLSLILSENRAPIENLSSNYFVIGLTEPSPEAPDSTCQLVPSAVRPQVSAVGQSQAQHIAQALSEHRAPFEIPNPNYVVPGLTATLRQQQHIQQKLPSTEAPDKKTPCQPPKATCQVSYQLAPSAIHPQVSAVGQSQVQHIEQALSGNRAPFEIPSTNYFVAGLTVTSPEASEQEITRPPPENNDKVACQLISSVIRPQISTGQAQPLSLVLSGNRAKVKNSSPTNFVPRLTAISPKAFEQERTCQPLKATCQRN